MSLRFLGEVLANSSAWMDQTSGCLCEESNMPTCAFAYTCFRDQLICSTILPRAHIYTPELAPVITIVFPSRRFPIAVDIVRWRCERLNSKWLEMGEGTAIRGCTKDMMWRIEGM